MNLPDVKYAIPADTLTATISALEFARDRYEQEASALIGAARHEQDEVLVRLSRKLGRERLEQADRTGDLVDFFLHL